MRNLVSPPFKRCVFTSPKAKDERDDETGNRNADLQAGEDQVRVLAPPGGIATLEVELEEPSDVDTERGVGEVGVAGPVQGAGEGNGGVEAVEDAGGGLPYVLVKGEELPLVHSCLDVPARVG